MIVRYPEGVPSRKGKEGEEFGLEPTIGFEPKPVDYESGNIDSKSLTRRDLAYLSTVAEGYALSA